MVKLRAAAANDQDVQRAGKYPLVLPERFADPALDPVALDRLANFGAHPDAQAAVLKAVGEKIHYQEFI